MSNTQQFTTKKISDLANATTPLSGTELFAIQQSGAAKKITVDTLQSLIESVDWGNITGKPTFATVATSGSYNDLSDTPAIPTVPTNVSAFTNDAGYLTSAVTSFNGNTGAVTYTAPVTSVNGNTGAVTIAVPTKTSDLTNDSGFTTNTGTVTSVRVQATSPVQSSTNTAQSTTLNTTISLADNYGDTKNPYASKTKNYVLAAPSSANGVPSFRALVADDIPSLTKSKISDFPTIPTKTSDLTNDSGYLTSVDWDNIMDRPTFATVATSGSYNDLSNKPTMVTSVNGDTGAVTGLQTTSNLVTSLSASSTDAQYASAKCVYNLVGDVETLLASI